MLSFIYPYKAQKWVFGETFWLPINNHAVGFSIQPAGLFKFTVTRTGLILNNVVSGPGAGAKINTGNAIAQPKDGGSRLQLSVNMKFLCSFERGIRVGLEVSGVDHKVPYSIQANSSASENWTSDHSGCKPQQSLYSSLQEGATSDTERSSTNTTAAL